MTDPTLLVHIIAGSLGVVSGFVALYAAKGAGLHRKSGMVFVCTMLTMSILGATMAALRGREPASNIPVGVLTAYMVFTALTTVRPLSARARWLDLFGTLVALAVGLTMLTFGLEALVSADGQSHGLPAFPFLMFSAVGLGAGAGDVRMMRAGGLRGASRIARHLWRMCLALALAVFAFVPRLGRMLPQRFRIFPLLVLPVVVVLVTMIYWLWRVRARRRDRTVVIAGAREAPALTRILAGIPEHP
jgi:uncharacterized membrane protein/heme/copper-type cytochrome/quinol oxidase subunit 4